MSSIKNEIIEMINKINNEQILRYLLIVIKDIVRERQ